MSLPPPPHDTPIFAALADEQRGRHHWAREPRTREVPVTTDPDWLDTSGSHPLKPAGEPMRYRRDVTRDDWPAIAAEIDHVRAHLSSVADADDDPDTNADDVTVQVVAHVDGDPGLVSVIGELDAEPNAPYLRAGYDPDADDDGTRFTRYSEEGQE